MQGESFYPRKSCLFLGYNDQGGGIAFHQIPLGVILLKPGFHPEENFLPFQATVHTKQKEKKIVWKMIPIVVTCVLD